ncbi:hypothetical protein C4D60_Mb09t17090 [Musa balbisiana]|uniref:Uncharacterized protein n=1 Tax=Musa balbisiana TaxID=52838 RepID=A0A4S8IH38_MUSBA|nr:hypothetical protein C4D60_Mb09t17090 [Musa balbisiana]
MYLGKNWIFCGKEKIRSWFAECYRMFRLEYVQEIFFFFTLLFSSECVAADRRLKLSWSALEAKEADYQTHLDFSFVALFVASPENPMCNEREREREMVLCEQRRQLLELQNIYVVFHFLVEQQINGSISP